MNCKYRGDLIECLCTQGDPSLRFDGTCSGVAYGIKLSNCTEFECEGIEIEPEVYSGCSGLGGDCPNCGR